MVTIGLPFFNNQRTLAGAIRSIFAQTLHDWQLILVDDGSTDGSLEVARRVQDPRVSVITDKQNVGLAARLNQIVELAERPFVARMDADDLMDPKRLARQLAMLQANPRLPLVDTGLLSIDENDQAMGARCCYPFSVSGAGLASGQTPVHCSVVGRTDWFRRNRYDCGYRRAQDLELWSRTFVDGSLRIRRIPEPLYFYREESSGNYARVRGAQIAKRQILRKHGLQLIGRHQTHLRIAESHAKQVVYYCAYKCRLETHLVAARNQQLATDTQADRQRVIRDVLTTPVPGLE